jgi:hypothetical protein
VNSLEQDALGVLSLIRSVKNSLAPINRIPPEVLLLIPDYYDDDTDQGLIALTHVCRGWRDMFISRSSLWTQLDCTNVDKTRTYIQRSKSSPLEIFLEEDEDDTYLDGAFLLVAPHIHRIRSLTIWADAMPDAIGHLYHHAPLLEELDIDLRCARAPVLDSTLFDGDLSSLRELSLSGVITSLPWNNMANLTIFNLKTCRPGRDFVTRLLDFFESAPLLHTIMLEDSIPKSSNVSFERIVSLPHLEMLSITAKPAHSVLLDHICIPIGALLILDFSFSGEKSPLREHLPETTTANLRNISHITTINLLFGPTQKFMRMNGPSGGLRIHAHWKDKTVTPYNMDRRILRSIDPSILATTYRLAVSRYKHPRPAEIENCPVSRMLSFMDNLRTLVLTKCNNLPFILALNPEEDHSELLRCPNLEELVLYVRSRDQFHIGHLISMAKERASRDAKLSSITIVGMGELAPGKEVFKLRGHVKHVHYRVDDAPPDWDDFPDGSGDESE